MPARFDFFALVYPEEARMANLADALIQEDPGLCAGQCRRIIEPLVQQIVKINRVAVNANEGEEGYLAAAIYALHQQAIIDDRIHQRLMEIKNRGNDGMHRRPVSGTAAAKVVSELEGFCGWYLERYPSYGFAVGTDGVLVWFKPALFATVAALLLVVFFLDSRRSVTPRPSPSSPTQPSKPLIPTPRIAEFTIIHTARSASSSDVLTHIGNVLPGDSVAVKAWYQNVTVATTTLSLMLRNTERQDECGPVTASYEDGSLLCMWEGLKPGGYTVDALLNGVVSRTVSVTLLAPDSAVTNAAPPRKTDPTSSPPPPKPFTTEMSEAWSSAIDREIARGMRQSRRPAEPPTNYKGCEQIGYNGAECQRGYIDSNGQLIGPGHFTGPGYME